MQLQTEEAVAARREIVDLLRQQIEILDSPLGITVVQLRECYEKQSQVQELREKPQAESIPLEAASILTDGPLDASTARQETAALSNHAAITEACSAVHYLGANTATPA